MKILAVDTATEVCGVAVLEDDRLVAEYRIQQRNVHNEKLVAAIETLLADASLQIKDLDGLAAAIGPGSFTGLRIGLSVCKGLAFSANLPLAIVNTLDAMAHEAHFWKGKLCAVIKARAEEVYFATYEKDLHEVRRTADYRIEHVGTLARALDSGTLVIVYPPNLRSAFSAAGLLFPSLERPVLSALSIGQLGYRKLLRNESVDLQTVEPFYLKDFQPKRKAHNYDFTAPN